MATRESIQHPAHEHALVRRELWDESCSVECRWCRSHCRTPLYCCTDCRFLLDEPCALLEPPPMIEQHPSHSQHPLTLTISSSSGECVYSCSTAGCSFVLAPAIAVATTTPPLPPAEQQAEEILKKKETTFEHVLHDHHHPLSSFHAMSTDLLENCKACKQEIRQGMEFYGCTRGCMFLVHEECAQLPAEIIDHPFHPRHTLTLSEFKTGFTCEVCSKFGNPRARYNCNECDVRFHVHCVAWTVASHDHEAEVEHHHLCPHKKLASCLMKVANKVLCCEVCKGHLSGQIRYCLECRLYLHNSCLEKLPKEDIVHHLHPEHPLVLQPNPDKEDLSFHCRRCYNHDSRILYKCETCNFILEPGCVLGTNSVVEEIKHPAHEHVLALSASSSGSDSDFCSVCNYGIRGKNYQCKVCQFYIHTSCAELPLSIQHPLHPPHPLLPNPSVTPGSSCSLCRCTIKLRDLSFECADCKFYLHIDCATAEKTFKHPRHEHNLARLDSRQTEGLLCNSCGKSHGNHSQEFYGCLSCEFNLHDYCLLDLPQTIKHKCHPYHPLVLFDEFIDRSPDDLYCDYCEEIRHPNHGVYRCEECYYTVHIDCVLPPKMCDNPLLDDINRKVINLKKSIQVMKIELEESRVELLVLRVKRDTEAFKAGRLVNGFYSKEEEQEEDDDNKQGQGRGQGRSR